MRRITMVSLIAATLPTALHAQTGAAAAPVAQAADAPAAQQAGAAPKYAQHLVEAMSALHPELIEIDVHATPPGATRSMIVAARSAARVGRPSDADDIGVFKTGEPRVAINRRGNQNVEVELPLFDVYKQAIGVVKFAFPYPPGTDEAALVKKAGQYRDEMSRRILDVTSLFDPAQLDPRVPTRSYAQYLIDDALAKHPEVEVLALHARTPKSGADYPIIASNIGRFGKPADAADRAVITSGKPHAGADVRGARFEAKVPLQDASGATLGALAVIFTYSAPRDDKNLQQQAEKIAAELRSRIASAANLDDPYPATQPTASTNPIEEYNKQELGNKQELPMTKEVASGAALGQSQEGYSEAIKNQAGVQATNSAGSSNDAFAIRGIKLNLFSNYRLDGGLPIAGVITNPTENKDRVETLKGANALMFGVASPAGIINLVTERAGPRDITTVGIAGNDFGQYGVNVDVGRRVGAEKQLGLRVNASGTHLENGVDNMSGEGYFASLGADLRASSRLTLQGDVEYYERRVPEQAGISLLKAVNGEIPITRVPDPRNALVGRWNLYTPKTTNAQARADYELNDDWKVLMQVGNSASHRHRNTVRISDYDLETGANGVVTVQPITNDYINTFGRTELLGHFQTWSLSHDLTVGLSRSSRHSVSYDLQTIKLAQRQSIFDPIELDEPQITKRGTRKPTQISTDTGLYAYDTIGITRQLKALVGLRRVRDDESSGAISSTSYVSSPAAGILFDVLPTTTLFASYMEGLEAGGTAPANAANQNEILAPAISKQKEIGIRSSYVKGLSLSASWFDITRANAVTDPVTKVFGYNGDLKYKGVEATVAYDITRDWKINAAVLWLNAKQISPDQPLIDNKVPENTPKWNANVGVSYRVAAVPGLTLKAGAKWISKRPVNPENQGYIPDYTLYDVGVNYATKIGGYRTSFGLNIDNLTNERYWNSVQTGTYGIGMDRSIKFNAKIDF
ncbi:TonB-dependent siderophore receptor [Azoarcus sp. KH32C]|uniref:TonB-dependent receptor n=1 Tax=Azoarcus sp. KH32C TaxID=748247 RepID=UPI0002385E19|nr:TonB-dependent receptor [Azoarcus sp. KH32C]BAL27204.1 TonB-dependent siderophore receptor [Azoarcus sp. KH32C]